MPFLFEILIISVTRQMTSNISLELCHSIQQEIKINEIASNDDHKNSIKIKLNGSKLYTKKNALKNSILFSSRTFAQSCTHASKL